MAIHFTWDEDKAQYKEQGTSNDWQTGSHGCICDIVHIIDTIATVLLGADLVYLCALHALHSEM